MSRQNKYVFVSQRDSVDISWKSTNRDILSRRTHYQKQQKTTRLSHLQKCVVGLLRFSCNSFPLSTVFHADEYAIQQALDSTSRMSTAGFRWLTWKVGWIFQVLGSLRWTTKGLMTFHEPGGQLAGSYTEGQVPGLSASWPELHTGFRSGGTEGSPASRHGDSGG